METFTKISANSVIRNSDGLAVKFLSRDEIYYSKGSIQTNLFAEIYVGDDGAPDGRYIYLKLLKLPMEQLLEMKQDLIDASVPLQSTFRFDI